MSETREDVFRDAIGWLTWPPKIDWRFWIGYAVGGSVATIIGETFAPRFVVATGLGVGVSELIIRPFVGRLRRPSDVTKREQSGTRSHSRVTKNLKMEAAPMQYVALIQQGVVLDQKVLAVSNDPEYLKVFADQAAKELNDKITGETEGWAAVVLPLRGGA